MLIFFKANKILTVIKLNEIIKGFKFVKQLWNQTSLKKQKASIYIKSYSLKSFVLYLSLFNNQNNQMISFF